MLLEFLQSISKIPKQSDSTTTEKTPSELLFLLNANLALQRQPTAEFGSKIEDRGLIQLTEPDDSSNDNQIKPPIDPNSLYPKLLKGLSSLSQMIKKPPTQLGLNSPNRVDFQSTRDTPTERPHRVNSYQSSPAGREAKKKFPSRPSSSRSSPRVGQPWSPSRISPKSEINSSVATLSNIFRKDSNSQKQIISHTHAKKPVNSELRPKGVKRSFGKDVRDALNRESLQTERLLQSSRSSSKQKSSKNPGFALDFKRQEKMTKSITSPKVLANSCQASQEKTNLRGQFSARNRPKDIMREDVPSYTSITTRTSLAENMRTLSQENRNMTPKKSLTCRASLRSDEDRIVITPVNQEIKSKILDWLFSINLIKEHIPDLEWKLPKICRNGLIFSDLLNKLEGRQEVIKGIIRNNDSKGNINANYLKIMHFLQKSEKMNPRYFGAQEYLVGGNEDVFWGFLDDIYCFYHHKISPFDPRYKNSQSRSITPDSKNVSPNRQSNNRKRSNDNMYNEIARLDNEAKKSWGTSKEAQFSSCRSSKIKVVESNFASNYSSIKKVSDKDSNFYSNRICDFNSNDPVKDMSKGLGDLSKRLGPRESYSNLHSKRASICFSGRNSPSNFESSRKSLDKTDMSKLLLSTKQESEKKAGRHARARSQIEEEQNIITIDMENQIIEWLEQHGFSTFMVKHATSMFEDPLRNGTFFCDIVAKFEKESIESIFRQPKSIDECRYNIYTAFHVLSKKETPIPSFLRGKEETILKGNRNIIYTLLHSLKKAYTERGKPSILPGSTYEISNHVPPYSEKQIGLLKKSLIGWLHSLGLIESQVPRINNFDNLIYHLKDGILLCDLASLVLQKKTVPIHAKPITELQCRNNIKKALEALKNTKNMGQRFVWKDKEVYEGDQFITLGLLEDIHRLFDGVVPRRDPHYFSEGPYIVDFPEPERNEDKEDPYIANGNYRPYLSNLKHIQSKGIRSTTCPRQRPHDSVSYASNLSGNSESVQITPNMPSDKFDRVDNAITANAFYKTVHNEREFKEKSNKQGSDLTFSSPVIVQPSTVYQLVYNFLIIYRNVM